jgi:hypothetical protein
MSRTTALPWDCSFAFWWGRRRHGGSRSPGAGAEPALPWPPICAVLLSLGLWLLIWGVFLLGTDLTEILRNGARALLTQAVEAEVAEFLAKHTDLKTETGQQRVVRHGHLPEREIMTGIGPVAVRQPRVRDRD